MNSTAGVLSLLVLTVIIGGVVAALVAALSGLLARLEGQSMAGAVRSAGAAFATTMAVMTALLALAVSVFS